MLSSSNRPHRCSCKKSFKTVAAMDQHRLHASIHLGSSNSAPSEMPSMTTTMTTTTMTTTTTETGTPNVSTAAPVMDGGDSRQPVGKNAETKEKKKKKTAGGGGGRGGGGGGEGNNERMRFNSSSSSFGTYTSPQYQYNSGAGRMVDTWQAQDWSLCDKDCGWCGHCYD